MKKIFIIIFSIIFSVNATLAASCDQNFYWTLRSWYNRTFNDSYQNYSSVDHWISSYSVDFIEEYDYNNSPNWPIFNWTPWIISKSYIVSGWLSWIFLNSSNYSILYHPPIRSNNNLLVKYNINYYSKNWSSRNWPKAHTECKYYQITWCWDWIKDTSDWESCDNWTSNWTAWNLCNTSCQLITPNCWNWVIEWTEKCDNGASNGTPWNSCSATCQTNNNNSSWNWLGTTTSGAWEWNVPTNSTNWWNF